jgi:hypothetical protein
MKPVDDAPAGEELDVFLYSKHVLGKETGGGERVGTAYSKDK